MELGCREAAYPATGDRKVKEWATRIKRVARPSPAPWTVAVELASAGQPAGGRSGDGG